MVWLDSLLGLCIAVSLLAAACTDVATRRIPNAVVLAVAIAGSTARLSRGPAAFSVSAAMAIVIFALLLILHARGLLGGGDVKLIPAIALGLPLGATSHFIFVTVMTGGGLALLYLLGRWMSRDHSPRKPPPRGASLLRRIVSAERWRIARHGSLPYGVAIACGGIWVVFGQTGH